MVNYPNGIAKRTRQGSVFNKDAKINFANRGMSFESAINATNDYYLIHGVAVIHKKPTPVQIVKVDYPKRSRAKIVEASLGRPQRRTILVFTKAIISTLRPKKRGKKPRCL